MNYTFLFTDIEGSTRLWEQYPASMSTALAYHDSITTDTIAQFHGRVFKTVGDGVCAVFESAGDALQAALTIQRLLHKAALLLDDPLVRLAVRMGLYTGPAEQRDQDFFGATLNRVARLMNAAHGGQVLLSAATREQLGADLPDSVELRDLGTHRLRDLTEPEHIFQALAPDFPANLKPIRSQAPRPTNLPAQLTSFIGRDQDIQQISKLLRQPNTRLLTLLGMGGIGKTRLALQIGSLLRDEYEDGIFFINLTQVDADHVLPLIAQTFQIQERDDTALIEQIKSTLQPRQLLLICDNFEHVMEAAPHLNELLAAAPRLKILVTSRESLFIYGEHLYHVPPLALPEQGGSMDELRQASAVALFVERVRAWQPDFDLTEENAKFIIQICRQLDGLPLALELAAARVRDLSLEDIADQLDERLNLMSQGPRDLSARQRTMRGAIEWSYDLLDTAEQRIFAQLAVFEGAFSQEAADAIMSQPDLMGLRHKSLLEILKQPGEITYFYMLGVLREFALEKLNALPQAEGIRQKHAAYYQKLLEETEPQLNGREQIKWFNRLEAEYYNVRAALHWQMQQKAYDCAGAMIGILWRYWGTQSLLSEGQQWAEQILFHAKQLSPRTQAKITQGAGRLSMLRNQYARAVALQQTSLELYRALEDQPGQAAVLLSLGETEYMNSHPQQAEQHLQQSLALFRTMQDQAGVGRCLNTLGKIATQTGNFAEAEPLLRESLELARKHGSTEGIALALYNLAGVLRGQKKYAEAAALYRESSTLYIELGFDIGVAVMRYNEGFTMLGVRDYTTAKALFLSALKMLQNLPEERNAVAECLVGLAATYHFQQKPMLAVRVLGAARALLDELNTQLEYDDQAWYFEVFNATSTSLEERRWQVAWGEGQAIPQEKLFSEIMKEATITLTPV